MSDLKAKTKKILHDTFEIDLAVLENESADFSSLGLDSLDVADLIVLLEKQVGKKIPLENFLDVRTIGDIYTVVTKSLSPEIENQI